MDIGHTIEPWVWAALLMLWVTTVAHQPMATQLFQRHP